MEPQISPNLPEVKLEDAPIEKKKKPRKVDVFDTSTKLDKKITQKIESEVEEAIGDVGRRKEYREALAKSGITMDWMVEKLKNVATDGEKDSDKIKALQVLLKSLGVDKTNDKEEETKGTWEDALLDSGTKEDVSTGDYDVVEPKIPEFAQKKRTADKKISGSIYD